MAVKEVGDVLRSNAGVLALVTAANITPIIRPQSLVPPAIVLQRIARTPQNALNGWANLDSHLVQLDVWSTTYIGARAIADAARTALQAAAYLMTSELDDFDSDVDPPLYRVTQTWTVWTT